MPRMRHTYVNAWSGSPTNDSGGDGNAVALALRMQTVVSGRVMGVRFFRDLSDGAEHIGMLYHASDMQLERATLFHRNAASGSGAGGWESAYFGKPRPYAAGDRFVVGVFFASGNYWLTPGGVLAPVVNGNLTITADGDGGDNGLYGYGAVTPVSTFGHAQYGVDVIFLEDS
jgi:hypothetical protein